jgi:serine/threonine protein kinase
MTELKPGSYIELAIGGSIKVEKELGRGGQGIVYLSEFNGQKYALKWYTAKLTDSFFDNLKNNIEQGAPSKAFLWPLMLTKKQLGSFGYVMELRKNDSYEFGDFLLAKVRFQSIGAIINAALQICEGFYYLHLKGLSYQDLNDGNFFINPATGDVLICDNDNVTAQGENSGILGKARYMAPEIVQGGKPDKYSDYFSLAVILFMLFYGNHPLEGKKVVSCPCMTEENERKHFGSEAIFILDKNDRTNLPVRGVHHNVIRRWPLFTKVLQDAFIEAFGQELIKNPTQRMMESKWEKIIRQVRNQLVVCSSCENETFAGSDFVSTCINCGRPVEVKYRLRTNDNGILALTPKKIVLLGKIKEPFAVVRVSKKNAEILAMQNLTQAKWIVETLDGKLKDINPTEFLPLEKGLKIYFAQHEKGEII